MIELARRYYFWLRSNKIYGTKPYRITRGNGLNLMPIIGTARLMITIVMSLVFTPKSVLPVIYLDLLMRGVHRVMQR
jgi:hypothetical protein